MERQTRFPQQLNKLQTYEVQYKVFAKLKQSTDIFDTLEPTERLGQIGWSDLIGTDLSELNQPNLLN